MGHTHLATLPGTRRWKHVVHLLDEGAPADAVVTASAVAAEKDFAVAADDPVLVEAVRLLALMPQAARTADFGERMRALGVDVPDAPILGDLTVGTSRALEEVLRRPSGRTDFGEIVRRALLGTMSALIGDGLPGLFEADAEDVRVAVAKMGRPNDFSRVVRAFFGRVTADTLASWLDRTLSTRLGADLRFKTLGERDAFDRALDQYCIEATRIIHEFSGAWYGKTLYRDGTITSERAAAFAAVAFRKITEELQRKRDAHA